MSRFFKSAAFPILIVVVLAFFASKLVGSTNPKSVPTFGQTMTLIEHNGVKSVNLDQKNNSMTVVTSENLKYSTGYPNGYVSTIINEVRKNEGGPALHAELQAGRLADELFLTIAPKLVGAGRSILEGALPEVAELKLTWLLQEESELFARYRR